MKKRFLALAVLVLFLGGISGCAEQQTWLHTYDKKVLAYPDDFPNDQPVILAFLNANDRNCDKAIRPLRAFAARDEVFLAGVMTYSDNSFLEGITVKNDIVFPVMLDPNQKMFNRFGVSPDRCPTYLLLSPSGKVIDRQRDISRIKEWYKPVWVDKALGRPHRISPEEMVERTGG